MAPVFISKLANIRTSKFKEWILTEFKKNKTEVIEAREMFENCNEATLLYIEDVFNNYQNYFFGCITTTEYIHLINKNYLDEWENNKKKQILYILRSCSIETVLHKLIV